MSEILLQSIIMAVCKRYWISVNSILKLFRALYTKTLSLATYHLLIFQNANNVIFP